LSSGLGHTSTRTSKVTGCVDTYDPLGTRNHTAFVRMFRLELSGVFLICHTPFHNKKACIDGYSVEFML
jgi:hypothetical protein